MSYRTWPAAVLTGVALTAAGLVVGQQAAQTSDGCRDSAGWFTAAPAAMPGDPAGALDKPAAGPGKPDKTPLGTVHRVAESNDQQVPGSQQFSGCLDLDRIEIPAPVPDGRA